MKKYSIIIEGHSTMTILKPEAITYWKVLRNDSNQKWLLSSEEATDEIWSRIVKSSDWYYWPVMKRTYYWYSIEMIADDVFSDDNTYSNPGIIDIILWWYRYSMIFDIIIISILTRSIMTEMKLLLLLK